MDYYTGGGHSVQSASGVFYMRIANMKLLEINGLEHAYTEKVLFSNTGLTLNKGECMGIVGANGSGKSTLLKICRGEILPDAGRVWWNSRIRTGYLDQYAQLDMNMTLSEYLRSAFSELYALEKEMNTFYEVYAAGDSTAFVAAAACQNRLENAGFYTVDTQIEQVAAGLGLLSLGLERKIAAISSGQRAKLILGKLLLDDAEVVLLDEPTNFLDREHVDWLGQYISGSRKTFMIVSHAGEFLQRVADCICAVENRRLHKYYGTYADYLLRSEHNRRDYLRRYARQQEYIARTEEYIRRNQAGNKCKNARGRRKHLQRLEHLEAPESVAYKPVFRFEGNVLSGRKSLLLQNLAVGYSFPLLSGMNMQVAGGEKILLRGFNGVGKTTLLQTLMRRIRALSGEFSFASSVTSGYFAQTERLAADELTPLEVVSAHSPGLQGMEVQRQLSLCGISRELAVSPLMNLSGGELARVKLCLLTLHPCNFLLLDEPTSHLDSMAKAALQRALAAFRGTVIIVTHEESFCRGWVDRVVDIAKLCTGH